MGCTDTLTPFLDKLVKEESLELTHNYVGKICSASRSSLLSGRYPSHLGQQNGVLDPEYPVSLTRQVSVLSNELREIGYTTHIIGYISKHIYYMHYI